jgi:hypothetical protein
MKTLAGEDRFLEIAINLVSLWAPELLSNNFDYL